MPRLRAPVALLCARTRTVQVTKGPSGGAVFAIAPEIAWPVRGPRCVERKDTERRQVRGHHRRRDVHDREAVQVPLVRLRELTKVLEQRRVQLLVLSRRVDPVVS